ncbi:MAG: aminotransferase class I/II-fold pyridoxal phosphate-dependent enzyme, partial [Bifidobacteriaceae bacterium]|nr:aminotransferase class I/II-fold pyridoxal phosphate-dependent enzyme [Bifidobacteriaceae bacterium]
MTKAPVPTLSGRATLGETAAAAARPWRRPKAPGAIALTGGFPWPGILPTAALARAFNAVLSRPDAGETALPYHLTEGTEELRAWIAAEQGADLELVQVTNGALHSVSYVLDALVDPGDPVVVEDPTYPLALGLFHHYGARVVGAPVDADGIDVEHLKNLLVDGLRPKLVYVIPDFQNPTGATLT